jgi:outer membrane protein
MNSAVLIVALSCLLPSLAQADTLRDAIALAYRTSPVLHGQQAAQRATEEGSIQARAGWLPQVGVSASAGYLREPYDSVDYAAGTIDSNNTQAALTLTQPLYSGGRVAGAVHAADARAEAGQAGLRETEAQLFQSVIGAYADVLRDAAILAIRHADLDTLRRQLANTGARFQLGAGVTRTDVAQAETQQDAALAARASAADIATARAAALPSVGVQASVGYIGPAAPFHTGEYQRTASALITVTEPIYSGGLIASQVRQARDRNEADRQTAAVTERQAMQAVLTAWSQMRAGETATAANQSQVAAAEIALKGYQAEYAYGLRSTLDVLIADENLRSAQVNLAQSRHDTLIAQAALLAATGDLRTRTLLAP